ncbi:DUF2321 domain-containing protein [Enterococcus hirae]|nr:DUF2321 domain-containing protein [Enterococcus hirae]
MEVIHMGKQYFQKVCTNGHQISDCSTSNSDPQPEEYCEECGSKVITTCPTCRIPILGHKTIDGVITLGYITPVPKYCRHCSNPYPWTSLILESAVELLSLDEDLPDSDKILIKTAIPDLLVDTPKTKLAEAKFKKGFSNASKLVKDSLYNLLVDVLSESVKKTIFPS